MFTVCLFVVEAVSNLYMLLYNFFKCLRVQVFAGSAKVVTSVNAFDVNIPYSGSEEKVKCNDKLSGTVNEEYSFILDPCLGDNYYLVVRLWTYRNYNVVIVK